ALWDVRDAASHNLVWLKPVERFAFVPDVTPCGTVQHGNAAEKRRLACAVGADERDDAACLHSNGDAGERGDTAVMYPQLIDVQQPVHSVRPWIGFRRLSFAPVPRHH